MTCIPFKNFQLCEGDYVRFMLGIRIFVGQITSIDEYTNIVAKDVVGNDIVFKLKNTKFIQKISKEEYEKVKARYVGGNS